MTAPRLRASEIHRRPTPHPGFDVAKFARDSERHLRASAPIEPPPEREAPTGPPPPYHPASMAPPVAREETSQVTTPLDAHLRESRSRLALVRTEVSVGSLSREEAASVLRGELRALAATARSAEAEPLAAWLGELGSTVEELGGIGAFLHGEPLRVFLVDDDVALRDRLALAVESLGHSTRTATSLHELAKASQGSAPDVVVIAARMAGEEPDVGFSDVVRELARSERTQVVVYVTAPRPPSELDATARARGARSCFCPISTKVDALAAQVAPVLDDIAWVT